MDIRLNQTEALRKIKHQQCFGALDTDGIWKISIREYAPLICVALHDGSGFPHELEKHSLLPPEDRIFEEDPHTAKLVESQPVVISGGDSRYYYDLNRAPAHCDQTTVFGRRIWKEDIHPLSSQAKQRHAVFYEIIRALVGKIVDLFGYCLIVDIHSYNYSRIDRETPLFNLGTTQFKRKEEYLFVCQWKRVLADINFPGMKHLVAENDVFEGKGYFLQWMQREFPNTCLTVPLDIKKIYCDEVTGEIYPLQFRRLTDDLNSAIHSASFIFQQGCAPQIVPPFECSGEVD